MKYLFSFLTIVLLLTFGITFGKTSVQARPSFSEKNLGGQASFQEVIGGLAQESSQPLEAPKTLEEVEILGKRILTGFPKAFKESWQETSVFWQKMINWFKNLWYFYISSWLQNIWQKINSFLGKEVEKRKPEIKEEFEKEKQEMKEDMPKVGKSLWQRFKELLK